MGSLPLGHKNRSWPSTVCKAPYSGFGTSWLLARPLRDARRGPHCCWHGTKQNGSSERQSPTAGRARTPPQPRPLPPPGTQRCPRGAGHALCTCQTPCRAANGPGRFSCHTACVLPAKGLDYPSTGPDRAPHGPVPGGEAFHRGRE